jgi:hypothetical protein
MCCWPNVLVGRLNLSASVANEWVERSVTSMKLSLCHRKSYCKDVFSIIRPSGTASTRASKYSPFTGSRQGQSLRQRKRAQIRVSASKRLRVGTN